MWRMATGLDNAELDKCDVTLTLLLHWWRHTFIDDVIPSFQVEKRIDAMRLMLEKKDATIDELRSRLNRAIISDEGTNVSCDQVTIL